MPENSRRERFIWGLSGKVGMLLTVSVLILPWSARGQALSDYSLQAGAPAFTTSSSLPGGLGFINVANGNAHLEIRLGNYPQRGSRGPLSARLIYDSRRWFELSSLVPPGWSILGSHENINGGWSIRTTDDSGGYIDFQTVNQASCPIVNTFRTDYTVYSRFSWLGTDGVYHDFPLALVAILFNNFIP